MMIISQASIHMTFFPYLTAFFYNTGVSFHTFGLVLSGEAAGFND